MYLSWRRKGSAVFSLSLLVSESCGLVGAHQDEEFFCWQLGNLSDTPSSADRPTQQHQSLDICVRIYPSLSWGALWYHCLIAFFPHANHMRRETNAACDNFDGMSFFPRHSEKYIYY
jgi:hypothetical protein